MGHVRKQFLGLRVGAIPLGPEGLIIPKGFQSCLGHAVQLRAHREPDDPVGGHSAYGHLCQLQPRPQEEGSQPSSVP